MKENNKDRYYHGVVTDTPIIQLVNGTKNELQRLVIQAQSNELLYRNLYTRMENTPFRYLSSDKNVLEYSLYQIMNFIIDKKVEVFFFIENKENKIIAFVSYFEDKNKPSVIKSMKVANFYMTDNDKTDKNYKDVDEKDDVLYDTLELMGDLLMKYEEVNFSASIYNMEAIKDYDLFFKKHKGDPKNRNQNGNEINWKLFQEPNP